MSMPGKKPYDSLKLDAQLCFPLYAAARQVTSLYNPALKPLGLTYTEYVTFMALWEHDGASVGELGERLYLNNSTLTPLLKRMERDGYITRMRKPEDERAVVIRLTEKGWQMRDRVLDVPEQVGRCINLTEEKAGELYMLLHELLAHINREERIES